MIGKLTKKVRDIATDATQSISDGATEFHEEGYDQKLPSSPVRWFLESLLCPILGLQILARARGCMRFVASVVVIQGIASIVLIWLCYALGTAVYLYLTSLIQRFELGGTVGDVLGIIAITFSVYIGVIVFAVGWSLTADRLCGYLGGKLTEHAISSLGLFEPQYHTTIANEFKDGVMVTIILMAISPFVGLVSAVPFLGQVFGVLLSLSLVAYVQGIDELRDPLAQFGCSRIATIRTCNQNKAATWGIGLLKSFSTPVPFVGGLMMCLMDLGRIGVARRMLSAAEGRSHAPDVFSKLTASELESLKKRFAGF